MEPYVAEEVARTMLLDPAVRAAFARALEDPAFAASPARRLEFFYRRHPSWDERKDLLPVLRLDAPPPGRDRPRPRRRAAGARTRPGRRRRRRLASFLIRPRSSGQSVVETR